MNLRTFVYKLKTRIHRNLIINSKGKIWYYWLYDSYWHYRFFETCNDNNCIQYITARPNPGAGIGHQIANWLAGYNLASYYNLQYAIFPFSDLNSPLKANEWDVFLGLNREEVTTEELLNSGYKKVLLPRINFYSEDERELLNNIIASYKGKKVVFLAEMDQYAGEELKCLEFMREKYWSAPARENDRLLFDEKKFSVAVHIRRGDIVQVGKKQNDNLTIRWLDTDYYVQKLERYLKKYAGNKEYEIYIFSQSDLEEIERFQKFENVKFCNHMNAIDSFLHMVNADMLVMSRSGMSYQAAKLNRKGIIIYPNDFWREPVEDERWVVE